MCLVPSVLQDLSRGIQHCTEQDKNHRLNLENKIHHIFWFFMAFSAFEKIQNTALNVKLRQSGPLQKPIGKYLLCLLEPIK